MLRERPIEIEPRRSTPTASGGFSKVPRDEQLEPGRALALLSDPGWGKLVKQGRFEDERFDDELVDAAAALVSSWGPDPAPAWVTAVPSLRHPELVHDFAERLAAKLGLPYGAALPARAQGRARRASSTTPASSSSTSSAPSRSIAAAVHSKEPVLLIDDTVDSRWTLTEAGRALRRAGVVAVWPLALASSGLGG